MKRDIKCPRCGRSITPEQIEIGQSLVCRYCAPKPRKEPRKPKAGKQQRRRNEPSALNNKARA